MAEDASGGGEESSDIICNTQAELNAALTQKCQQMYDSGEDLPSVTIHVNLIDLAHTEQYKDFSGLVSVGLGDTVHCYNSKLNLATDARVISLTWDCIRNQAVEMTLGDYEYNYFSSLTSSMQAVSQVIGPGNTILADRVQGILNAMTTQFRAQKNIAQTQDVRAMLFEDLNPNSPTFGALCIGTQGIQISHERNPENTDWKWGTAINFQSVVADYILTGILSDKTGNFSLNMDTGELNMKSGTFSGNVSGATITSQSGVSYRGDIKIDNGVISSYHETGHGLDSFELLTDRLAFVDSGATETESSFSYTAQGFQATGYWGYCSLYPSDSEMVFELGKYNGDKDSHVKISPGHLEIVRDGETIVSY